MKRLLAVALVTLALVGCTDHPWLLDADTTFVIEPGNEALADAVAEALATVQPSMPYQLSMQVGGLQGDGFVVYRRTVEVPGSWGTTNSAKRTIAISADTPPKELRGVVAHEIGHAVGLEHWDRCDDSGIMYGGITSVGRYFANCELEKLASLYGVELHEVDGEARATARGVSR